MKQKKQDSLRSCIQDKEEVDNSSILLVMQESSGLMYIERDIVGDVACYLKF